MRMIPITSSSRKNRMGIAVPLSNIVQMNLPGGVDQAVIGCIPAAAMSIDEPIAPLKDRKPPVKIFFMTITLLCISERWLAYANSKHTILRTAWQGQFYDADKASRVLDYIPKTTFNTRMTHISRKQRTRRGTTLLAALFSLRVHIVPFVVRIEEWKPWGRGIHGKGRGDSSGIEELSCNCGESERSCQLKTETIQFRQRRQELWKEPE